MIFPLALLNSELVKVGWACKCPACQKGDIYKSKTSLDLREECPNCGLDLKNNDSADGPAVFLIFILGAALVPIALITDAAFSWPLWLHAIIWGALALGLTLGSLRPLKAYIIALQYKHRRSDWKE